MGLNLWAHLFQSGREMIVKQSSQSSIFSLLDNNISSLLDEVVRRACAFPYYISWKVYLPFRENYHRQETISLLFEKRFREFPGWDRSSALADHTGSTTSFAAPRLYILKIPMCLSVLDILVTSRVVFFFFRI